MQELKTAIDFIQGIGFVGILIILSIPVLRKKLGFNGNSKYQEQIDELKKHAQVANKEMGAIKESIAEIKSDISFIRGSLTKVK